MLLFAVDDLVILVTFTCKQNDVAGLCHLYGRIDRLAAVGDAGIGGVRGHIAGNVADDILRRLVVRIVACDDGVVGISAGGLGQLAAADLRAAADRAEHADQAVRIVGAQRLQSAGQRETVVAVVHDKGAAGQPLHNLKPALHRGVGQCGGSLRGHYAECPAQCDGAQRIGRAERAGGHDLNMGALPGMAADKINAQRGAAAILCQHHAAVVSLGLNAKADLLTTKAIAHEIAVRVICIVNHRAGVVLGKQAALGAFVVLKIRVLAGADVILRQVRKGHDLKRNAVHAMVAQGLTADLQHTVMHTGVQHLPEQAVQLKAFGGGVGGGLVAAGNIHTV